MIILYWVLIVVVVVGVVVVFFSGCVVKSDVKVVVVFEVFFMDGDCVVFGFIVKSGILMFDVMNDIDQVFEFYLFVEDGLCIVGEVENIVFVVLCMFIVVVQLGEYFMFCKLGMVGEGVGWVFFIVMGDCVVVDGFDVEQKQKVVDFYGVFVKDQVGQFVFVVEDLVVVYEFGDDEIVCMLFLQIWVFYECIELVVEVLGDFDFCIDYCEVDVVVEGFDWIGFYCIEKDFWVFVQDVLNVDGEILVWQDWVFLMLVECVDFGDLLFVDVQELYDYVYFDDFMIVFDDQGIGGIFNGVIVFFDEVVMGKIFGEEDWWFGIDLYDFVVNVEGLKMVFLFVQDFVVVQGDDGEKLVFEIELGYLVLEVLLVVYGLLIEGFVGYVELIDVDKCEFMDFINVLVELFLQFMGMVFD